MTEARVPRALRMKNVIPALCIAALACVSAAEANSKKEVERLQNCGEVLKEILDIPDNLPTDLLNDAECVIVIPSVKKFAMGIGGSYGRGAIVCRSGAHFTGPWGTPAMFALEGANIGLQLGGQATDFVLLVMNPKGAESVLKSKVKAGRRRFSGGGSQGPHRRGANRYCLEGGNPDVFQVARTLCRRIPRRLDTAGRQWRE